MSPFDVVNLANVSLTNTIGKGRVNLQKPLQYDLLFTNSSPSWINKNSIRFTGGFKKI